MPIRLSNNDGDGSAEIIPLHPHVLLPVEAGVARGSAVASAVTADALAPVGSPVADSGAMEGVLMAGSWESRPYWVFVENGREYATLWWSPGRYGLSTFGRRYWLPDTGPKPTMRGIEVTAWAERCIFDARQRYLAKLARQRARRKLRVR